ncbi:hypothetical protein [Antricoccus suffuscus]|nr:hypothetical protein [Antricoccus suffuscus]
MKRRENQLMMKLFSLDGAGDVVAADGWQELYASTAVRAALLLPRTQV